MEIHVWPYIIVHWTFTSSNDNETNIKNKISICETVTENAKEKMKWSSKSNENSDKCAGRQLQTGDRVILRHNDNWQQGNEVDKHQCRMWLKTDLKTTTGDIEHILDQLYPISVATEDTIPEVVWTERSKQPRSTQEVATRHDLTSTGRE